VQDEERMMVISGIVRPIDIAENNLVQSQYVGNLSVSYVGKGTESRYLKPGWLGRFMNVVWPF
jgi:flagellar L-ring protein precursor FlgH